MNRAAGTSVSITTSSALNPALVLSLVCLPTGLAGLMFASQTLHWPFALLTFSPPLLALAQIIYFTIFDRDRLQNERHVEQKMLILANQTFGDKSGMVEIPLVSGQLIDNPGMKSDV